MNVIQTPRFKQRIKKLHKNQKLDLDKAIRTIIQNPNIGDLKKGDLAGIQVYKFKMAGQLTLVGYEVFYDKLELLLLHVATHENFYRDLKKKL